MASRVAPWVDTTKSVSGRDVPHDAPPTGSDTVSRRRTPLVPLRPDQTADAVGPMEGLGAALRAQSKV